MPDGRRLTVSLPHGVRRVLSVLADADHEAAVVGGSVRDLVAATEPVDWDVATDAPPEVVAGLFPGATWENRFGTVTVRPDGEPVEVTTYRHESGYRDARRPDHVAWGRSLDEDLARRDFTVNAIAWRPLDLESGEGELVDPYDGIGDLQRGMLRAVGDPQQRFAEDALRLVRAARFATRLGLEIEPATEEAIRRNAASAASLSGERVRDELLRILSDPRAAQPPSAALLLLERLGLLAVLFPELAALRGVPQAKALAGDALDHSLRTVDALPADRPLLRLAGLLHDLGKATTLADGHFIGHEMEGAALAAALLERLRLPRRDAERIVRLVRQHMFAYTPEWTDAAVRRFVRRVGPDLLDDLFALRAADNAASGAREPQHGDLGELRQRIAEVAGGPLTQSQLAIDGRVLMQELGLEAGPRVGELLRELLEAVIEDPTLNTREALLGHAQRSLTNPGAPPHQQAQAADGAPAAGDNPAATIGDPGAAPRTPRGARPNRRNPPS
jgi:poly(A) polymerase/tRNA nucleotidyltransferase (CCA-adding enzyme)